MSSCGGSDSPGSVAGTTIARPDVAGGEILLEPIGVATPDAFTTSVAVVQEQVPAFLQPEYLLPETTTPPNPTDPTTDTTLVPSATVPDQAAVATTAAPNDSAADPDAGGVPLTQIAGNVPGLYGGTRDMAACDQQQMIGFLESNPDKAAAWAAVQGIEPAAIREFIEDLTPVVLMRDTRVTNHGFADGKAQPHQSVLQAGHAVLVDRFGVPRAKCSCGNPLAPPLPVSVAPDYAGPQWPGFDPAQIVVVIATDEVDDGLVIVDLGTGDLITRPIGFAPGQQDAEISTLLDIGNIMGVQPGASEPTFGVERPALIVAIVNYHYGPQTPPGQIGLISDDGRSYGPWQAEGTDGQGGVANAYWTVVPYEVIPAGTYTVWDSEPSTWSTNADAGGLGFSVVRGVVGVNLPPAAGAPTAPTMPPTAPDPTTPPPPPTPAPEPVEPDGSLAQATAEILDQLLLDCGVEYDPAFVDGGAYRGGWRWLVGNPDWTADFTVTILPDGDWDVGANNEAASEIAGQCGFLSVG